MTHAQQRSVAATGNRYLHPDALASGMPAAWCDGTRVIRERPPAWVARDKLVIARLAIAERAFTRLFEPRDAIVTAQLTNDHAGALNAALESRIEFLRARGWR
jgi:hypothetical protein